MVLILVKFKFGEFYDSGAVTLSQEEAETEFSKNNQYNTTRKIK